MRTSDERLVPVNPFGTSRDQDHGGTGALEVTTPTSTVNEFMRNACRCHRSSFRWDDSTTTGGRAKFAMRASPDE
ncbi:hypothetical protein PG984_013368 [Apiospora sp. TS-2023a]